MTLLEPADAPATAADQADKVSSWVVLEDEVWCAVNGRGFRNKTIVTIHAICREQCEALWATLPTEPVDPFPPQDEGITFCNVYLCKHGEMVNDFQYFASAFDFYMSLGTPDLHSLLSRMKEDLCHLTVGKVSLQFKPVETVVRLEAGRNFEDPGRILEEDEFEALRRPIFLSRYLDKLASNLDAINVRFSYHRIIFVGVRNPFQNSRIASDRSGTSYPHTLASRRVAPHLPQPGSGSQKATGPDVELPVRPRNGKSLPAYARPHGGHRATADDSGAPSHRRGVLQTALAQNFDERVKVGAVTVHWSLLCQRFGAHSKTTEDPRFVVQRLDNALNSSGPTT